MLWVRGIFKIVALWRSTGHHGVDVQHSPNQTFQLIQLVKLKVCHLFFKVSGMVKTMREKKKKNQTITIKIYNESFDFHR